MGTGAGYTLASGSSSVAAASVVYALGLCGSNVDVHMPGGMINIKLNKQYFSTMGVAVCEIGEGYFSSEALALVCAGIA